MIWNFAYLIVFTSTPGVLPEQNDRYWIQPWKVNEIKAYKKQVHRRGAKQGLQWESATNNHPLNCTPNFIKFGIGKIIWRAVSEPVAWRVYTALEVYQILRTPRSWTIWKIQVHRRRAKQGQPCVVSEYDTNDSISDQHLSLVTNRSTTEHIETTDRLPHLKSEGLTAPP